MACSAVGVKLTCQCGQSSVEVSAPLSRGATYKCVECAGGRSTLRKSRQDIFFDERKAKTTPNPYNNVRFKYVLESTATDAEKDAPKKPLTQDDLPRSEFGYNYLDSWHADSPAYPVTRKLCTKWEDAETGKQVKWEDPRPKTDENADDPNAWLHSQHDVKGPADPVPEVFRWWYGEHGEDELLIYREHGGRLPKSTAHAPWTKLTDRRNTSSREDEGHFTYPIDDLGANDFNGDGFMGTASPLRETHEGGFSSRGVDRALAKKRWSDVYKACVRDVMLCGRKATDVVQDFSAWSVKITTLYSCVRDVKAEMERAEDQSDPNSTYLMKGKAKTLCPRTCPATRKGRRHSVIALSARR